MTPPHSGLWTPQETAAYLKVSLDELKDMRHHHKLAYVNLGYRTVRFRPQDVEAFVLRRRVAVAGESIGRGAPN